MKTIIKKKLQNKTFTQERYEDGTYGVYCYYVEADYTMYSMGFSTREAVALANFILKCEAKRKKGK